MTIRLHGSTVCSLRLLRQVFGLVSLPGGSKLVSRLPHLGVEPEAEAEREAEAEAEPEAEAEEESEEERYDSSPGPTQEELSRGSRGTVGSWSVPGEHGSQGSVHEQTDDPADS